MRWPEIERATLSGVPSAARFVRQECRVLWNVNPPSFRPTGKPAYLQALFHSERSSLSPAPFTWKSSVSGGSFRTATFEERR